MQSMKMKTLDHYYRTEYIPAILKVGICPAHNVRQSTSRMAPCSVLSCGSRSPMRRARQCMKAMR